MRRPRHRPIDATGRASHFLIILLALAAAVVAWWYLAPQSMPAWLARVVPASSRGPLLYKWHDDKGRLHVTDKPPADRPYETVRYDPNTNVVPANPQKR